MTAPLTPAVALATNAAEVVPAQLLDQKRWTAWVLQDNRTGKPAKKPLSRTDSPSTWLTFAQAVEAAAGLAGIGFQMQDVANLAGIDLDNCVEPATGTVSPFALSLLSALPDTYAEITPSGKGLRLFTTIPEGIRVPEFLSRQHGAECYVGRSARFLTVTGAVIDGRAGKLSPITAGALEILAPLAMKAQPAHGPAAPDRHPLPPPMSDPARAADLDGLAAKDDADLRYFTEGLPSGDRSERTYRAFRRLVERGIDPLEIEAWAQSRRGIMRYVLSKRSNNLARALEFLRAEVARAVANEPAPLVPDAEPEVAPTAAPPVDDGGYDYTAGKRREVKKLATNVTRYLRVARPDLLLRYNDRFGRIELDRKPFVTQGTAYNELLRDMCRIFDWDTQPSIEVITSGIFAAAERDTFDPVTEYLDDLQWDGADRLPPLLNAMGVETSGSAGALNLAIMQKTLTAVVARARAPGCKAENVTILVGPQSFKKSTFWRVIGAAPERHSDPTAPSECFSDAPITLNGDKDTSQKSISPAIHEIPELSAMKSAEREQVKHALSQQEEKFRPPYGREVVMRLRRGIRVGSTNESAFLNDPTGARRFLPIEVLREIDIPWVMAHRDQLWAQADALYKRGVRWWFEAGEHAAELSDRHEEAYDADAPEVALGEYLTEAAMEDWRQRGAVMLGEVAICIGIDIARAPRNMANRIGAALRRLGFVRTQVRRAGKRVKAWKHRSWDLIVPGSDEGPAPTAVDLDLLSLLS